MAEFELERPMPASAEAVFAVVSDLDRLPQWLPEAVRVRPSGAETVLETHGGRAEQEVNDWLSDALDRLEQLVSGQP
jgi:uncharacterized protein YndB with AHSA1/START domain